MFNPTIVIVAPIIFCICLNYFFNEKEIDLNPDDITSLRMAADDGNTDAQFLLGLAYTSGEQVEKDEEEAYEWLFKAADKEHPKAQLFLFRHYISKEVSEEDLQSAKTWITKSAKNGDNQAQLMLGDLYTEEWFERDLVKAYAWLWWASPNKADDQALLDIEKDLSETEIEEAKALARSFFPGKFSIGLYSVIVFVVLLFSVLASDISNEKIRGAISVFFALGALFLIGAGLYQLIGWNGIFGAEVAKATRSPKSGLFLLIVEFWPYVITVFGCWMLNFHSLFFPSMKKNQEDIY